MDSIVLRLFQSEVEKQSEFALISATNISNTLERLKEENSNTQLWFFVQSFLISTANVSKLLWGSKDTIENRESLRKSLDINEDAFFKIRKLRNHFEHFDERLETWASSSKKRNYIDSNIGPSNMIVGAESSDYLRNFDTTKGAITFKGEEYLLQPIINELETIYEKASSESKKPHW